LRWPRQAVANWAVCPCIVWRQKQFASGHLIDDGIRMYEWDFKNRLVRITDNWKGVIHEYRYDAANRRIEDREPGKTTIFVLDQARVLEYRRGGGVMKSLVHGPALDELILQDVNPFEDLVHGVPVVGPTLSNATGNVTLVSLGGVLGDAATTRVWFIQDSQNSVIAITNSTGYVLEGYEYHPYGDPVIYAPGPNGVVEWGGDDVVTALSNYAVVNLYTGREWDHESGLYHYRSRYMSPIMGRFISSDTIGVWGDANNLGNGYAYVGNGPYNGIDPTGQKKCKRWNVVCQAKRATAAVVDKIDDALESIGEVVVATTSAVSELQNYGDYCGGSNKGKRLDDPTLIADEVDRACHNHDNCEEDSEPHAPAVISAKSEIMQCNAIFVAELERAECPTNRTWGIALPELHCEGYRKAAIKVFLGGLVVGAGRKVMGASS
jgi:RHS repeat-associated protein